MVRLPTGPSPLRKKLADNIKKLRGDESQNSFAKRIGVTQASLNRLEAGMQNPSLDFVYALSEKLRVSPQKLLFG